MKRYWFYIICTILIVSCNNYAPENKNFDALEIPDIDIVIDYDIDQVHETVLKQKLDDLWSLQLIDSIYTDFKNDSAPEESKIVLEDSIQHVKIIEYIKPFVPEVLKLKTEVTYYNRKKDTITALITSKLMTIDQDTIKSFKITFKE